MKAAFFEEPGRIVVEDVPVPRILDDELLVRVRAASVCGTDLRIRKIGHFKIPPGTRRVLGHEVAGEIVRVGSRVPGYSVGMHVNVAPNIGCGACDFCREGYNNMCPRYEAFGISIDGGFQEYMRVPSIAIQRGNVFVLPEGLGYREAALVEPLSCCFNGMSALRAGHRDIVVIVGAGPMGTLHVMLSRVFGVRRIIVSDLGQTRLDLARSLGADVVVDVTQERLADVVARETDGRGADVVVTAVSSPAVQAEAIDLLATHGRVNFFAGLAEGATAAIDTHRVHYRGLVLTGTTGSTLGHYAKALELVAEGRIDPSPLVTGEFPLDRIDDAMDHAASGAGMKAMIRYD